MASHLADALGGHGGVHQRILLEQQYAVKVGQRSCGGEQAAHPACTAVSLVKISSAMLRGCQPVEERAEPMPAREHFAGWTVVYADAAGIRQQTKMLKTENDKADLQR